MKWYPVKVKGGQEETTKERIKIAVKEGMLSDFFKEIFVPYQRVYTVKDGKKSIKKKHFGYIVVQGDLLNKELCDLLLTISGVYGFITPEGIGPQYTPTPLLKQEVNDMLGVQINQDEIKHDLKQNFKIGEQVKIIDGPLINKIAIIRSIDANKKKLEATIQIFGKETKTEISYAQVQKI